MDVDPSRRAARILELAERGFDPAEIIRILAEEDEPREAPSEETFPPSVRVIAQAFACRQATVKDLDELYSLLNRAYRSDWDGDEAYLAPSSGISREAILQYISSDAYRFLVFEVPRGFEIEEDGTIVATCCFSTDGESKRDGVAEGALCSIRWLAVHEKYQVTRCISLDFE